MGKKILVIDDNQQDQKIVARHLNQGGYQDVVFAMDGEEGIAKVESEKPDLIIVDVLMPKMDGYTFVKSLRAKQFEKQTPLIVVTGREETRDLFELEGVTDYITKPYESKHLLEKVGTYLE